VVAHYISEDNILESSTLAMVELQGKHEGENIAPNVVRIIEEWGLLSKLGFFQMDNAGNNVGSGCSGVRFAEAPAAVKLVIVALYASLSAVRLKIALFFSWLLDSASPSLGFSSASSAPCVVICVRALKTSATRVSGVERYMFRNSVSGIGEAWMLDSNGYNSGSERVEEDLSGLLVGASGVAGCVDSLGRVHYVV
jgi:hypothetical protein